MEHESKREFSIPRDPWDVGCSIYKKNNITIHPGITILVGCNGTGKSTLIHFMKQELTQKIIPFFAFDNLMDGGDKAKSAAGFFGDTTFLANAIQSSEGENIMMNLERFVCKLGRFIHGISDEKEIWVFLDAVDSGFSIDNIAEIKDFLHNVFLPDVRNRDVYIVISTNAYEFTRGENCFDVASGEYLSFKDYEEYRDFIMASREKKNARVYKRKRNRRADNG